MAVKLKTYRWPKTAGALIDRLYKLQQARKEANKVVDVIKAEETALKGHIIDTISKQKLQGARGRLAQFNWNPVSIPTIEDMEAICKWQPLKKGSIILQRRLNTAIVRELWEDGKDVPGVGTFDDIRISLTAIRK